MPLKTLRTISRNKAFDFKYADGEEIIVYSSDDDGRPQREHAIVITRFEQQIVKDRIRDAGVIVVGASRDRPPRGSLGELLKQHDSSPQIYKLLFFDPGSTGILFPNAAGERPGPGVQTGAAGLIESAGVKGASGRANHDLRFRHHLTGSPART